MSVKVMSWVWEQDLPTTKKMLLLAIADHSDDDGNNAWPSKARLAKKVGVLPSYVRRLLRELEDDGWITTARQRGGTLETPSDRRPNLYQINLTRGSLQCSPIEERGSLEDSPRGSLTYSPRGSLQCSLTISSTSDTSSTKKERKRDLLFEALVEACEMDMTALTSSARGVLNRATNELRQVEATPEQVLSAARLYRTKYPNAAMTPSALTKHYPSLKESKSVTERNRALSGEVCMACAGTGWQESVEGERTVVRCADCRGTGRVDT